MNILEYFTANVIAVYYNEKLAQRTKAPFLLEFYFGNIKQESVDLSWIKATAGETVLLRTSNWDADPTYRDFEGFTKLETEMPLYREGVILKESDRKELLRISNSNVKAGLESLLKKIYDGITALIDGASAMREFLRSQLVCNGKISLNANGTKLDYDYKIPTKQKYQTAVAWSTKEKATPIADLIKFKRDAQIRTGENITDFIMNSETLTYIIEAETTSKLFADSKMGVPEEVTVKNYLSARGIDIVVYDKSYKMKKGETSQYFIPTGKVVALPHFEIGKTVFSYTPEEADLMYSGVSNVAIVDTGVAISTTIKPTPVKVETVVSMSCLPSFEGAELLTIIDVTHNNAA